MKLEVIHTQGDYWGFFRFLNCRWLSVLLFSSAYLHLGNYVFSKSISLYLSLSSFGYHCRLTFETALKLRGGPSIVFAHSLGNNVFRYFLEWLKLEIAPKKYVQWLDDHIHAYFAVGMAPMLLFSIDKSKQQSFEFVILMWYQVPLILVQLKP